MNRPRPGDCVSCGKWCDYRTKDMCRRCYRTAWARAQRQREYAARPPKPPKAPKPVRQPRAAKPTPKPKPEPRTAALPRGWFAGSTDESRAAWASRFTPPERNPR